MDERFVRGYAAALIAVIIFSLAFGLVEQMIEELAAPRFSLRSLRAIHARDQKEARSDQ